MAESDKESDPLFFLWFWQLERAQARVPSPTIRTREASEISSNV